MPEHDVIVIGASAGGVPTLRKLVRDLPARFPAALLVVSHFPPESISVLPEILSNMKGLPAIHATDGALVSPGHVYIAPPDHHLIVGPNERM